VANEQAKVIAHRTDRKLTAISKGGLGGETTPVRTGVFGQNKEEQQGRRTRSLHFSDAREGFKAQDFTPSRGEARTIEKRHENV
jgi:hypothetical protein